MPIEWDPIRAKKIGRAVLSVLLILLPVDVSAETRPGRPRFLPVVYGLPTVQDFQEKQQGKVMLGGCLAPLYAPLWVLVW